ncbi:MAG: hypothetical protein ACREC5_05310, partial [Thermoplasmata archaeon]
WLSGALYNRTDYGVRGVVGTSPAGLDLLFEAGYSGSPEVFRRVPPPDPTYSGAALGLGPAGEFAGGGGAPYPTVIASVPGELGEIWNGPGVVAPAGDYRSVFWLKAAPSGIGPAPAPSTPIVSVNANAFGDAPWFVANVSYGSLATGSFVPVTFPVDLSEPVWEVVLRGYSLTTSVVVTLEYVEIVLL